MSDYQSFELSTGEVLKRVEATCRHLTTGGSFNDTTSPTSSDVVRFVDNSYYWLLGELAKNGYAISVTDTEAKAVLQEMQALDAAVQVEFSQPVSSTGEENDRHKALAARRDRMVRSFLESDALEQLGAVKARSKSTYLEGTGRSIDRKDTVYDNNDVVPGRFPRGYGQRRDVPSRSGTNAYRSGADPDL